MKDGLTQQERSSIQAVFDSFPKLKKVILFGSRAMGTFRAASDLDLVLDGEELNLSDLLSLKANITELNLAIDVDLILQHSIQNEALQQHIQTYGKIWWEKGEQCIEIKALDDLCTYVCSGGTPKSTNLNYYGGTIPWLNTKEINFNRIYNTEKSITQEGFDNSSTKWILPNSIIIAMYGATAGKVAINKIPLTTNQACCNLQIDQEKADYRYIYYQIVLNYTLLASLANGGAQQNLNAQQIKQFEIKVPSLVKQKKIATILSALDDKIELNNKINANLEAQAQAIFKSWFVDFEPFQDGEFIDSELGKIPKGWKVASLLDIADYLNGLAMQKYRAERGDKELPILKIKELRNGYCDDNSERCSSTIKSEYIVDDGDVVFSWSGSLLIDIWSGGQCGLNQHLFKVTSQYFSQWFYYFWTNYHLAHFIEVANNKATTMGHITRKELVNATVVIPDNVNYQIADGILSLLLKLIISNRKNTNTLKGLREFLLPKLMSGEMKV